MNGALYFGGSFNPPHFAHTACAKAAARAAGLDEVILVPTGQSAMKNPADFAPAADRLAMTRLAADAVRGDITFAVDAIEVNRPGTSYTVDTVAALCAKDARPVHWLIGADQLLNLNRWHRFEELLRLAKFWVMARPGYVIDWRPLHPTVRALQNNVVTVPQMNVSATEIRRRLRTGESVTGLLTPAVETYIRDRGLYGTK